MSAPGLLEQWQLQQRALKEAERRRKTESLEMHKQFRGVVNEEELKLRALKEEERLKKLETEKILHGYKGGVKDEDLWLTTLRNEERQKKAEAIKHHQDYRLSAEDIEMRAQRQREEQQYPSPVKIERSDPRDSIEQGAVNRLKENYNSPSPTNIKGFMSPSSIPSYLRSPNVEPPTSPNRQDVTIQEGTVVTLAKNYDGIIPSEQEGNATSTGSDAGLQTPTQYAEKNTSFTSDAPLLYEASQTPSSMEKAAMYFDVDVSAPRNTHTGGKAPAIVTGGSPTVPSASDVSTLAKGSAVLVQLDEHVSGKTESKEEADEYAAADIIRFDINISFGIITTSDSPGMDGYMQAVAYEVNSLLKENQTAFTGTSVNPKYAPFVKQVQWDEKYQDPENRPNLKRCLVSAAVPIFMTDQSNIVSTRQGIIDRLQHSIKSGSFITIALKN